MIVSTFSIPLEIGRERDALEPYLVTTYNDTVEGSLTIKHASAISNGIH